jgi:CHAT domain-containing protein
MLAGIKHLYLVPDALLRSLPFDVLVTEPPAELAKEDHRSVHWLARDYAVTLLPTVASLRSVAVLRHQPEAPKTLIAFADPILSGKRDKRAPRGASLVRRDRLAAPDAVRSLPSLPDTRTEVEEVARSVGAGSGDLYFAERATEHAVKSAVLQDFQTVLLRKTCAVPRGKQPWAASHCSHSAGN